MKHAVLFISLAIALAFGSVFMFRDFLTRPELNPEEGVNLQLGRNLLEFGTLRLQEAPGKFEDDIVIRNAATGWVLPAFTALSFRIFGVSFSAGRVTAALFFFTALLIVFFLHYWLSGPRAALIATLLFGSFAPFYAFGKRVLSDFPAAVLLLAAVYFYLRYQKRDKMGGAVGCGILFGLFAATKPTYLGFFLPILFFAQCVDLLRRRVALRWLSVQWLLIGVVIFPTLWFSLIHPVTRESLREVLTQFARPGLGPCAVCTPENIRTYLTHSTVLYVILLTAIVMAGALVFMRKKGFHWLPASLAAYSAFTLLHFFWSPGNFRYLIPLEVVFLAVLPAVIPYLIETVPGRLTRFLMPFRRWIVVAFVGVQTAHLIFFPALFKRTWPYEMERYIREVIREDDSVGIINSHLAAAVAPNKHLTQFYWSEENFFQEGVHPLTYPEDALPKFLILNPYHFKDISIDPYREILDTHYTQIASFGGEAVILRRKSSGG